MRKAYGLSLSAGILSVSARAVYGGVGTAFGFDSRPEIAGIGFFALCTALCLAFYLLLVLLLRVLILKKHRCGRRMTGGMIPFLPFSECFHLADSRVTIGRRPSALERRRDGEPTFRPFPFP